MNFADPMLKDMLPESHCKTCNRELNNPNDPMSADCGGDCVACMAAAGDPECVAAVAGAQIN